ncbi:MAG: polyprenyl synthetase family protein [Candidatus Moranbacteria bacterium]|nr:polyprenyl synthetase family protein [Candidatus Moranbacteria bacterium]
MDAKIELQNYKKVLDRKLARYFAKKLEEMQGIGPSAKDIVKSIRDMVLAGGKRMRANFIRYGYLVARPQQAGEAGKPEECKKIIEASMSIELTHIFLLIHDDIIDRDDFRHGVQTIHKKYERLAKRFFKKTDPKHFGDSMAIVAGDMAAAFGNEIIFNSRFSPERKQKALLKLQEIVANTVSGEILDVMLEAKGRATEKEILEVHRNKTAKYTVEGPLHLGALLAGADDRVLRVLSKYAVPVGIAFQIQDDILGAFGNEKKLGKPVCSDLREGKQTLLVAKALENGDMKQRKLVKKLLGNKNVSESDIESFRRAIRETGSLEYSQNLAKKYVEEGKAAIEKSGFNEDAKDFLIGIADYIVKREV